MYVTASNPVRSSVTDTVLITILEVNDLPVISGIEGIEMIEDTPYELISMANLIETGSVTDVDNTIEELLFQLNSLSDHLDVAWDGDVTTVPVVTSELNYNGPGALSLCVVDMHGGWYEEVCTTIGVNITSVNDIPYFSSEMHAPVGIGLELYLPLSPFDVDSENLVVTLTEGETNPDWVALEENALHGTPNMLGEYPIFLTLSDGEVTVLDTFNLHVVNFKPQLVAIEDIPNDQGGKVYVGFTPSFMDNGTHSGQGYDVYRHDMVDGQTGWVLVASGNATGEDNYIYEVTTLSDSLSVDNAGMTDFKIVASMDNGTFHSESMMGYSVDNIHPGVPEGIMAMISGTTVDISWNESDDEDFQYYIIEKSVYDAIELIETAESFYLDENYIPSEVHSYRIAAVDYSGNQSEFSEVVEVAVLAIDNQVTPEVFTLHQNYPNPFNPTTQIKYDLAEDALVSINIYDVMGRMIKSLKHSNQSAGYHSLQWDATNDIGEGVSAGMYIYTIHAGEYRSTKKMILLK